MALGTLGSRISRALVLGFWFWGVLKIVGPEPLNPKPFRIYEGPEAQSSGLRVYLAYTNNAHPLHSVPSYSSLAAGAQDH